MRLRIVSTRGGRDVLGQFSSEPPKSSSEHTDGTPLGVESNPLVEPTPAAPLPIEPAIAARAGGVPRWGLVLAAAQAPLVALWLGGTPSPFVSATPRHQPTTADPRHSAASAGSTHSAGTDTGTLAIASEPSRVSITVDGIYRGRSPVVLDKIAPGHHVVIAQLPAGHADRIVEVRAGVTTSAFVTANPERESP